ncbi:MAG: hypothetical protein QXH20_00460 [Candidatus Bathyarchaeia archaeon]
MEPKEFLMVLGLILTLSVNSVIVAYSYGKLSRAVEEVSKLLELQIRKLEQLEDRQRDLELRQVEEFVRKEDMLIFANKTEARVKELQEELKHVRRTG